MIYLLSKRKFLYLNYDQKNYVDYMALTKLYHIGTRKPVNDLYKTVIKPKIANGDIVPGQLVYSNADGEVALSDDHDTEYPVGIIIAESYVRSEVYSIRNYRDETEKKYFYDRMIKLCQTAREKEAFLRFMTGEVSGSMVESLEDQKIMTRLISECCPLLNSMLLNPPLNKHGYKILL